MPKKGKNIKFRDDQIAAISEIEAADPETDFSKVVRLAVDELLAGTKWKTLLVKARKKKR